MPEHADVAPKHTCLLYSSFDEQAKTLTAFVEEGHRQGHASVCLVSADRKQAVQEVLNSQSATTPSSKPGGLWIGTAGEWMQGTSGINVRTVTKRLQRQLHDVLGAGFKGLRMAGEVTTAEQLYHSKAYESMLDRITQRESIWALCQYDRAHVPAMTMCYAIRRHSTVICEGHLCHDNFFYEPPEYSRRQMWTPRLNMMIHYLEDLSARELALERSLAQNRLKDEVLAELAHELRDPLNAILMWCSLIETGRLDASRMTLALESIKANGKHQARLLEALLDGVRMATGKLGLHLGQARIDRIAAEALDAIMPLAERANIEIHRHLTPCTGVVDRLRLRQVFGNLLHNALKFTPPGGRIEFRMDVLETPEHSIRITVSDTGVGIPSGDLGRIFEQYRQGERTERGMGLGLGLSIVQHIVRLHGGSVRAMSEGFGKGASFVLQLPLVGEVTDQLADVFSTGDPMEFPVRLSVTSTEAFIRELHGMLATINNLLSRDIRGSALKEALKELTSRAVRLESVARDLEQSAY